MDNGSKIAGKANKGGFKVSHHSDLSDLAGNINGLLTGVGLKFGENVGLRLVETAINHFLSDGSTHNALSEMNTTLSNNATRYLTTRAHVGLTTTSRVRKLNNTPLIQINSKDLSNSQKDYIESAKHKQLILMSGFNEKGYSFLMEDTFMSVEDFLNFYELNKNVKKNMIKKHSGVHHVHGAIYSLKNKVKITNDMKYYDALVKIHLVKVTDLTDDPRNLIRDITNNKLDDSISKTKKGNLCGAAKKAVNAAKKVAENSENLEDAAKSLVDELVHEAKDSVTDAGKKVGQDFLDRSNIPAEGKEMLKNILESSYRSRSSDFGKIPEDQQYTDPNITDLSNRFAVTFNTSLNTRLSDSVNFTDRARIIATWNRKLGPGSIWDFNLTHHCGRGINLNYLYDLKSVNPKHPVGYVFVLEYFGDRRAKITRMADDGAFTGYAPVKLRCDFNLNITYLGKETDDSDDDVPVVYKRKRKDPDFEENSVFSSYFTPNRETYFHVPFDQIDTLFEKKKRDKTSKPFTLDYDNNIISGNGLLEQLQLNYEKHGFNPKNITEDDAKFNINKPPSESEKNVRDYEGTGEDEEI